jgi:PAS domain-containing protein
VTEAGDRRQRHLALILAKDLAANLATAMLLVDADGDLVFFNEAAEGILGRPYAEAQMSSVELAKTFKPVDDQGRQIPIEDLPLARAVREGIPVDGRLQIVAVDGRHRDLEVVAIPLFARVGELVGGLAVFRESSEGT